MPKHSENDLVFAKDEVRAIGQDPRKATTQPWQLIRAAFVANQGFEWQDGFIIFREWRDGYIPVTPYPQQFKVILSKTWGELKPFLKSQDEHPHAELRHSRHVWAAWFLKVPPVRTNLDSLLGILGQRSCFSEVQDPRAQWILAVLALDAWPVTNSLSPPLGDTEHDPENRSRLTALFEYPSELLHFVIDVIMRASAKLACVTSAKRQGLEPSDVEPIIRHWLKCIRQYAAQLVALPEDGADALVAFTNFRSLARYYAQLVRTLHSGEWTAIESTVTDDIQQCLDKAAQSPIVDASVKRLRGIAADDTIRQQVRGAFHDYATHPYFESYGDDELKFGEALRRHVSSESSFRGNPVSYPPDEPAIQRALYRLERLLTDRCQNKLEQLDDSQIADITQELITHDYTIGAPAPIVSAPTAQLMLRTQSREAAGQEEHRPQTKYLQHVRDALAYRLTTDYQWFRESGPLATDFEHGCVFTDLRNLSTLRDRVLTQPFLVLEGMPASGKSTLLRVLGRYLWEVERKPVYYFDYQDFRSADLAENIMTLDGVVVLEDLHRDPAKYFAVYKAIRNYAERLHVVWTLHGDKRHSLPKELQSLPMMSVDPTDDVDSIARAFLEYHGYACDEVIRSIAAIVPHVNGDLWLLANALAGHRSHRGSGGLDDWVKASVEDRLNRMGLEAAGNALLPRLIVAISCFYQYDIPTSEGFLEDLGFGIDVINRGLQKGYVTRLRQADQHLYGLHHTMLARLYWKHRGPHQGSLPGSYAELAAKYMLSNSLNALDPLVYDDRDLSAAVSHLLDDPSVVDTLLKNRVPARNIAIVLLRNPDGIGSAQAAAAFAAIEGSADIQDIAEALAWARQFPSELQKECRVNVSSLCRKIADEPDVGKLLQLFTEIHRSPFVSREDLIAGMNVRRLRDSLRAHGQGDQVLECIALLWAWNPSLGATLWEQMNKPTLLICHQALEALPFIRHVARLSSNAPTLAAQIHVPSRLVLQYLCWDPEVFADVARPSPQGKEDSCDLIVRTVEEMRLDRMLRIAHRLCQAGNRLLSSRRHRHTSRAETQTGSIRPSDRFHPYVLTAEGLEYTIWRSADAIAALAGFPEFTCSDIRQVFVQTLQSTQECTAGDEVLRLESRLLPIPYGEFPGVYDREDLRDLGGLWHPVGRMSRLDLTDRLEDTSPAAEAWFEFAWLQRVAPDLSVSIRKDMDAESAISCLICCASVRTLLELCTCGVLSGCEFENLIDMAPASLLAKTLNGTSDRSSAMELAVLIAVRHEHLARNIVKYMHSSEMKDELQKILGSDTGQLQCRFITLPKGYGALKK